jgi:hypothetical protein
MTSLRIGFALLLAAITALLIYELSTKSVADAAAEHGLLETIHQVTLAAASLAYFYSYRATTGYWKTAAAMLAIGAAGACLREFDFRLYTDVAWLQSVRHMRLHWLALLVVSLPLLLHIFRNFSTVSAVILLGLQPKAWPFMLSGALVGAALLLDRHHVSDHLYEELLETYGYAFLLFAALRHTPLARSAGATVESQG